MDKRWMPRLGSKNKIQVILVVVVVAIVLSFKALSKKCIFLLCKQKYGVATNKDTIYNCEMSGEGTHYPIYVWKGIHIKCRTVTEMKIKTNKTF